jgi:DNA-binding response OmpR family regulator
VPTVLIVEDDEVLAGLMRRHLVAAGYDVEWAADGDRALRKLRYEHPDVCVLDLMLPELDGWSLIEQVRADGDTTPIVAISARGSEHDKVHTLGIGADDYLVKPASMKELVARVGAAVRRARIEPVTTADEPIEAPGLRIDPRTHRVFLADGTDAGLTAKEFRLLWTLAASSGRVMSRDELQQRVWGVPYRPRDRSVDVCVRKIREKVDERSDGWAYVHTHYGIGYRFEATAVSDADAATA